MTKQLRLRTDGVTWREVDGEIVGLGLDSVMYFGTNASASLLWQLLADGATRSQLVSRLVEAFGIDENLAKTDVDAFVDDLRARGLVEP